MQIKHRKLLSVSKIVIEYMLGLQEELRILVIAKIQMLSQRVAWLCFG